MNSHQILAGENRYRNIFSWGSFWSYHLDDCFQETAQSHALKTDWLFEASSALILAAWLPASDSPLDFDVFSFRMETIITHRVTGIIVRILVRSSVADAICAPLKAPVFLFHACRLTSSSLSAVFCLRLSLKFWDARQLMSKDYLPNNDCGELMY